MPLVEAAVTGRSGRASPSLDLGHLAARRRGCLIPPPAVNPLPPRHSPDAYHEDAVPPQLRSYGRQRSIGASRSRGGPLRSRRYSGPIGSATLPVRIVLWHLLPIVTGAPGSWSSVHALHLKERACAGLAILADPIVCLIRRRDQVFLRRQLTAIRRQLLKRCGWSPQPFGTRARANLSLLRIDEAMPPEATQELINDTVYTNPTFE